MYSLPIYQGMQVGNQLRLLHGDSQVTHEPILSLSLSEQQTTKTLYSRETISKDSVSLVPLEILSQLLMQRSMD